MKFPARSPSGSGHIPARAYPENFLPRCARRQGPARTPNSEPRTRPPLHLCPPPSVELNVGCCLLNVQRCRRRRRLRPLPPCAAGATVLRWALKQSRQSPRGAKEEMKFPARSPLGSGHIPARAYPENFLPRRARRQGPAPNPRIPEPRTPNPSATTSMSPPGPHHVYVPTRAYPRLRLFTKFFEALNLFTKHV
jgi:hypothetical protein